MRGLCFLGCWRGRLCGRGQGLALSLELPADARALWAQVRHGPCSLRGATRRPDAGRLRVDRMACKVHWWVGAWGVRLNRVGA